MNPKSYRAFLLTAVFLLLSTQVRGQITVGGSLYGAFTGTTTG